MARKDGTGPRGAGSMTGKGLGFCTRSNTIKYGSGLGLGLGVTHKRGLGKGLGINQPSPKSEKELLTKQEDALQNQLKEVKKQLENL